MIGGADKNQKPPLLLLLLLHGRCAAAAAEIPLCSQSKGEREQRKNREEREREKSYGTAILSRVHLMGLGLFGGLVSELIIWTVNKMRISFFYSAFTPHEVVLLF